MRGASDVGRGARGDDVAKGAMDDREVLPLASAAEPVTDGVAEIRRMVGIACGGVSFEDRWCCAVERVEEGAGARDKRGNVLRILFLLNLVRCRERSCVEYRNVERR